MSVDPIIYMEPSSFSIYVLSAERIVGRDVQLEDFVNYFRN